MVDFKGKLKRRDLDALSCQKYLEEKGVSCEGVTISNGDLTIHNLIGDVSNVDFETIPLFTEESNTSLDRLIKALKRKAIITDADLQ